MTNGRCTSRIRCARPGAAVRSIRVPKLIGPIFGKRLPAVAREAENEQSKERLGPITPVTAAEGVIALASHDTHEVIVIDPDREEIWRKLLMAASTTTNDL